MDVNSRDPLQNIIPFRIKGVEISRFDSSGNLKIGTTTTTAPTVRLDISGGSARVNSGSATSTALTTTGRIGVNTTTPTVDLDVSGVVRMAALSATSTALTTTGRIGVNMATPTVTLDVSGAARMAALSATSTALTTVGRIGVNTTTPAGALDVTGATYLNSGSGSGSVALWTLGRIGVNNTAPGFDLDVNGRACVTASSATATAFTTTGRIGVNTTSPTVDLDVTGVANVSNYLSVGSGSSSGGVTTSNIPDAFYVRTGGSNWRDFIPLLAANSTTNRQGWGLDPQWYDVNNAPVNEIAKQFSYFAGYWLNANRAVVGTSFTVSARDSTGAFSSNFTFTATAISNGIITAYSGFLSQGSFGTQQLTPQQDGIDAGVARRSLSNRTLLMGGNVETGYLRVSGVARVSASSATATALTTTGRIGVNTTAPETSLHVVGDNTEQSITYIGETALYNFTSHTFSSPVNGRFGPTITQVRLTYSSAIWAQNDIYLTMNSNRQGIQLWTVPATGIYTITAQGASGSDGAPWDTPLAGYGKRIRITTTLIRGEQIQILVGQVSGENNTYGGGGGGGSFVVRGNTPIIIAGGGGGGDYGNNYGDWDKGSISTSGNSGGGGGGGAGGINGNGGNGSNANASGGGGFFTGGLGGASNTRGKSFIDGGAGGENAGSPGGFGGGSGFSGGYGTGGPGGGGYSGGGGGGEYNTGGGGGSYGISTITDLGFGGRYDAGYVDVVFVSSSQNDTKKVSAIFENGFVAASDGYVLRSDQRIKMNIITNNPTDNLAIIRQLRTVKHKYIDKINYNSDDYKYGFIAQEIHKVIPEAIIKRSDIIPSIYNKANIINTLDNKHILTFEEPLTNIDQFNGDIKLKCYNEQNEVIWIKIKEVIDEYNLEIEGDIHNKELFVYGHIVDDFLFIDKDTIWTVATAALQEVDRQQQADKARIVELEATVASQQSLIHDILERLNNNGL